MIKSLNHYIRHLNWKKFNFKKVFFKISKIIIFLIFICQSNIAFANENKYLIPDILISKEADSATAARNIANIEANREAFIRLLKNLSITESFSDYIDDEQIGEAIYSKNIADEKIADNWYQANFNIEFSKDYIDNLVENKDLENYLSLESEKQYLIFPIEKKGKNIKLWHDNNRWFDAWRSLIKQEEFQEKHPNIKLPEGDIDDIGILELKKMDIIQYLDVKEILKKYESKIAVFIDIYFDRLENNAAINITMVRKFTRKRIRLSFVNIKNIQQDKLYNIISEKIVEYLQKKDLSQISNSNNKKEIRKGIKIDILPKELTDWVKFKKQLDKMSPDIKTKIISVSADLIKINIIPNREINILKYLESHHIFTQIDKDNKYYIILE